MKIVYELLDSSIAALPRILVSDSYIKEASVCDNRRSMQLFPLWRIVSRARIELYPFSTIMGQAAAKLSWKRLIYNSLLSSWLVNI